MIREHLLRAICALAGLGCIALGAGNVATGALAAAAGSAFEAAPFLLFAGILAPLLGWRRAWLANLGGCGCTRGAIPGALAVPAIALCAYGFGPVPTLARTAVALGIAAWQLSLRRRGSAPQNSHADLFVDLERLGASAFLASLAAAALAAAAHAIPVSLAFVAGLGLGALAPCATAGIAIAAAFAHGTPAIAYGVLCTAGLVTLGGTSEPARSGTRLEPHARMAATILGCALGWLALRGPSGLVHPRLLVPIGIGAAIAFATLPRAKSRSRSSALVPLLMLGSLVTAAGPPVFRADATRLDDAFAGERLSFIGVASTAREGHTTLTRYAITCCRLDATAVSVRLATRLNPAFDGRWIAATGTLTNAGDAGLEMRPERIRAIVAPTDPYMYR